MSPRAREHVFACPFCQAASVAVIGRGGRFVHYRCKACAEVWTGMRFSEAVVAWTLDQRVARKDARKS
jgi:transposase-like protein